MFKVKRDRRSLGAVMLRLRKFKVNAFSLPWRSLLYEKVDVKSYTGQSMVRQGYDALLSRGTYWSWSVKAMNVRREHVQMPW